MSAKNPSGNTSAPRPSQPTSTRPPTSRVALKTNVVVIGAGQAGLSSAYHLKKRGLAEVVGMRKTVLLLATMTTALMLASVLALVVPKEQARAENNVIDCPNREGDRCVGTLERDSLSGSSSGDLMHARAGADFLVGRFGEDVMHGGRGPDLIVGDLKDDELYGEKGKTNS